MVGVLGGKRPRTGRATVVEDQLARGTGGFWDGGDGRPFGVGPVGGIVGGSGTAELVGRGDGSQRPDRDGGTAGRLGV